MHVLGWSRGRASWVSGSVVTAVAGRCVFLGDFCALFGCCVACGSVSWSTFWVQVLPESVRPRRLHLPS